MMSYTLLKRYDATANGIPEAGSFVVYRTQGAACEKELL
jgi:hypothetical protein